MTPADLLTEAIWLSVNSLMAEFPAVRQARKQAWERAVTALANSKTRRTNDGP